MPVFNEDQLLTADNWRWREETKLLPIGNSVVGSLTSSTDTSDVFRVMSEKDETLVQIKFSVDQVVSTYDYYTLETPVGNFYVRPGFSNQIAEGIFINIPGGLGEHFNLRVQGSYQGVFRGNYTLEVAEVQKIDGVTYATGKNHRSDFSLAISLDGRVEGWDDSDSGNNQLLSFVPSSYYGVHYYKFTISEGEEGKLVIRLSEDSESYNAKSFDLRVQLYNEGGRSLGYTTISEEKPTAIIENLVEGTYSFYVNAGFGYVSGVQPTLNYVLETEFLSTLPVPDVVETPKTRPPEETDETTDSASNTNPDTSSLDVIVSLFGNVFLLKGLVENKTEDSHTIEYGGQTFNFADVDLFVTTVVRDGEFTDEFAKEIADAYPDVAGIKYSVAVTLVGASLDEILLAIAGADGNYVG